VTAVQVVVATKNPDKHREMVAVLADAAPDLVFVEDAEWADVPETGDTLEENALLKAWAVVAATGLTAIADDTGLEVDALGGAPGVHTARFAGPAGDYAENRAAMLAALDGVGERSARFRTVIAMVTADGETLVVDGVLEGRITTSERGSGGFGYDPIFAVGDRTLAEIPEEEKNRISHRAVALQALAAALSATQRGRIDHGSG
jgi:XTP/dITP diphosphohydrolase